MQIQTIHDVADGKKTGFYRPAGQILEQLLTERDISQESFAAEAGLKQKNVSNWILGISWPEDPEHRKKLREAGAEEYVVRVEALFAKSKGLTLLESTADRAQMDRFSPANGYVPVAGAASCGAWIEAIENHERITGEKWFEYVGEENATQSRFGVIAKGDSMTGSGFEEGDVLVVDAEVEPSHGDPALVFVDGRVTVKKFRKHGRGDSALVVLTATNPAFKPQEIELRPNQYKERVEWARRVVFHKPRGR